MGSFFDIGVALVTLGLLVIAALDITQAGPRNAWRLLPLLNEVSKCEGVMRLDNKLERKYRDEINEAELQRLVNVDPDWTEISLTPLGRQLLALNPHLSPKEFIPLPSVFTRQQRRVTAFLRRKKMPTPSRS